MPSRRIRLFALHGRTQDGPLDYVNFFSWLQALAGPRSRLNVWPDLAFILESADLQYDGRIILRVISGDPDQSPLLFDDQTGQLTQEIRSSRWQASRTIVVIDPIQRLLALELRRSGVTERNLERYFSIAGREQGFSSSLDLDLSLIPGRSFRTDLEQFVRIKQASIEVREPNPGWIDSPDVLSRLAGSSRGGRAALTVTARRNDSLEQDDGIVALIKDQVSKALPSIAKATVVGRRSGEDVDSTITTDKHPIQVAVAVKKGAPESETEIRVIDAAEQLIDESKGSDDDQGS